MRLVKLLAYSILGYVLYELYLGMTEGAESDASGPSGKQPANTRRAAGGVRRPGKKVKVEDADGAQATHDVGRGVVH